MRCPGGDDRARTAGRALSGPWEAPPWIVPDEPRKRIGPLPPGTRRGFRHPQVRRERRAGLHEAFPRLARYPIVLRRIHSLRQDLSKDRFSCAAGDDDRAQRVLWRSRKTPLTRERVPWGNRLAAEAEDWKSQRQ